ncbi:Xaa-Pro dipeptidase [Cohnella sp. CIP 111063]|jgi:Xaa-Pro aminopeptidase|uniref:M24 family metallopeptidase n=1 Tax=unclassified Cohnella TaxID=2636738 RepID=UPI000B8BE856|nr:MULTISPECIES: aminopeptidase P family protein [unclassified Cohnella]OXS52248.1 Xaa-Pro dipeptidase [Cohnella sp. CIP 111063]PRX55750.1 Xaa-Pro aminopeptidase [Cohnella sp. SGD-V74]
MPNVRVARLREAIAGTEGHALLVTNRLNVRYLTGFTGTSGAALISADKAVFVTDFRYTEQAAEQALGFDIVKHGADMNATIAGLLKEWGAQKLLIEEQDVTYAAYRKMEEAFRPAELLRSEGIVEKLRMTKDEDELAILQEAADLADRTFDHILAYLKPGATERSIALEIEFFMRSQGATSSSFDTIVASGERSALPHGVASDKTIGTGEFVTLDFGAYYKGYCSDITRTVVVGQASDKHKEIYAIVQEAQQYALDHLRPGMTGKEGDALTRDIITRYGYGEYFGHGTGHGIGLEIHESPRLSLTGDVVLTPGMVVTVEPGIYLPGFGGVRIEDDVVMTEGGIRILTSSPKRLIELD